MDLAGPVPDDGQVPPLLLEQLQQDAVEPVRPRPRRGRRALKLVRARRGRRAPCPCFTLPLVGGEELDASRWRRRTSPRRSRSGPSRTRRSSVSALRRACRRPPGPRSAGPRPSTNASFSVRRQPRRALARRRVDRLLDVLDDVVEVLAAGRLGRPSARARSGRRPRSPPRTGCGPSPGSASPRPRRTPYSMLPSTFRLVTFPAIRTLKMSPTPRSKISSAGVRESMQLRTTASGCCPSAVAVHLAAEVAGQPLAGAEPLVPVLQDLRAPGPG